jgi:hypothetical protein
MKAMRTLYEAVHKLKRDPAHPVLATIEGLTVELRVVPSTAPGRSAAVLFAEIGPWEGETTEEILAILADARRAGARRSFLGL